MVVGIVRMRIRLRGDILHFKHGYHREEANEQKEQEDKESDRSDKKGDIDPGRRKITPR